MYELIIKNYVKNLTKEDVLNFAKKESTMLSSKELDIIYEYIKLYWKTFYKGNPTNLFNELKISLSPNVYNKIIELYTTYKNY